MNVNAMPDPVQISILHTQTAMLHADVLTHLIEHMACDMTKPQRRRYLKNLQVPITVDALKDQ